MQASNLAAKIKKAFAILGTKNAIPLDSSLVAGEASYETGFPPLTMTPIVAGGLPPKGADFNGILFELSNAIQSQQAAGLMPWDSDFSIAIGGYPKNSFVSHLDKVWRSKVENNTVAPNTDLTKWMDLGTDLLGGKTTFSSNDYLQFANGFIFQWGNGITDASGVLAGSFPLSFPNACFGVFPVDQEGLATSVGYGGYIATASTYTLTFAKNGVDYNANHVSYFAIGF